MQLSIARDPALIMTAVGTTIRLVSAFWIDLSIEQQAVLNAITAALLALVVAFVVRKEGQVPALLGFVQAVLALAVGFGAHLSPENQAIIMSAVGAVVAMFVRTQVTAPKTIEGDDVPKTVV